MSNTIEIAERLKGLREIEEVSTAEMAAVCSMSEADYIKHESGTVDFSVTMLCKCAERLGIDVTALFTGHTPKLKGYSIVRAGEGLKVERRQSFTYQHLASNFCGRLGEPFMVSAPYSEAEQSKPITLSTHEGQEMDYVLDGSLKVSIDGHEDVVNAGDTVYYDSSKPHGMIAIGGKPCKFLAILFKE
ncbi:MAG: XRE family transcriptional regulator [Firmicutes bacterium]|nr:XRE family transcriptional regulator [Bacillota bacterium]